MVLNNLGFDEMDGTRVVYERCMSESLRHHVDQTITPIFKLCMGSWKLMHTYIQNKRERKREWVIGHHPNSSQPERPNYSNQAPKSKVRTPMNKQSSIFYGWLSNFLHLLYIFLLSNLLHCWIEKLINFNKK